MALFDPNQHKKPADQPQGVPPSDYLLAITYLKRNFAKTDGKPYLRAKFQVIYGPLKGQEFYDSISLDLTNQGAMFRLALLSEQCGVTQAFDLDNDDEIKERLMRRPFKARVKRSVSGQYTNNGIERYITDPTPQEVHAMQVWHMEDEERRASGGGSSGSDSRDAPPPGDDDIPF